MVEINNKNEKKNEKSKTTLARGKDSRGPGKNSELKKTGGSEGLGERNPVARATQRGDK